MILKKLLALFTDSPHTFQGQENGEKIVLFLRRHPIVIILRVAGLLMAYSIPITASLLFLDFIIANNLFTLYLFIISIWSMAILIMVSYSLTMYTLDVWIITDRRIIDSNQIGFFNRTVSELHISRIQDIYIKTDGPIQTLVNFGNLFIQTAGTEERFNFLEIPDPVGVKDIMMRLAFPKEMGELKQK